MTEFKSKEEYEKWKREKKTQNVPEIANEQYNELKEKNSLGKKNITLYLILTFILGFVICGIVLYLFVARPWGTAKVEVTANPTKKIETEVIDKLDPAKFEGVNRAAKKIQASISVGVSYQQFGELLQNLATEISIAKDTATSKKEKELLVIYSETLNVYKDSYTLWQYKIEHPGLANLGAISVEYDVIPIADKYNLEIKEYSTHKSISVDSIQVLWARAAILLQGSDQMRK